MSTKGGRAKGGFHAATQRTQRRAKIKGSVLRYRAREPEFRFQVYPAQPATLSVFAAFAASPAA
jgi:hypothetical protein